MSKTNEKGDYFEEIVRAWLTKQGHWPTSWPSGTGAHPIDIFCVRKDGRVLAVDAKAKCARLLYADTGIDYRHFNTYFDIEKGGVEVWVIFGDHNEGWAYGASLSELRSPAMLDVPGQKPRAYPRTEGRIIYFPRSSMHRLFQLTNEQCDTLRDLSQRESRQGALI
jgi:hypothetical protein